MLVQVDGWEDYSLPKAATGKIDKRKIKEMYEEK